MLKFCTAHKRGEPASIHVALVLSEIAEDLFIVHYLKCTPTKVSIFNLGVV